ncbi:GNAT family N-acetyltransferase [Kutzneria chonburiensis]|uniref:GNAT family N-acetyltransferase n=1 Tax=Kutzneria chonburiensis TaxID=1483604 RepID=A0ABV6MVJ8_9PSEU|nr:GNAT family N-acetyltransferase [Kutzneria chonburiensis]
MEPVEINAGRFYLRQLRADDRIDDRPSILDAFTDPVSRRWISHRITDLAAAGDYVALRTRQWVDDERCSWAVADQNSGELLGEVGLKDLDLDAGTAAAACWAAPRHRNRGVVSEGLAAALRFGAGALGLSLVEYLFQDGNEPSRRVAEKCGFAYHRTVDQCGAKVHVWTRSLV